MVKLIKTVYARPIGNPEQEIGGVMMTAVLYCLAFDRDPELVFERELRRVLSKSPEHFTKRNQEKIDLGLA